MTNKSLIGDWIEFSYERFDEVCRMLDQVGYLTAINYLKEPAVNILNLHLMSEFDGKIVHYETVSSSDIDTDLINGNSFKHGLKTSCFMIDGESAYEVYQSVQWFDENQRLKGFTWQTEYGSELTREYVENLEIHFIGAFLVIQHLMMHCKELLSYRVEECTVSCGESKCRRKRKKYRTSQTVRIYTISYPKTMDGTAHESGSVAHTWHCDAWGVRGHYRHLKSGRVCYVKPYIKGKKKDAYSGREYILFKEGMKI